MDKRKRVVFSFVSKNLWLLIFFFNKNVVLNNLKDSKQQSRNLLPYQYANYGKTEPLLSTFNQLLQCTKNEVSIKDFCSKYDQIRSFLRIWSHLLKKSLMKNFIFVQYCLFTKFVWRKGALCWGRWFSSTMLEPLSVFYTVPLLQH